MNRISIRIFSIIVCLGTIVLRGQTADVNFNITSAEGGSDQTKVSSLTIENCFNPKYYPKNARLYGWITQNQLAEVVDGVFLTIDMQSMVRTPLIKVDSFINIAKTAIKATTGEDVNLFGMPIINWTGDYKGWFEAGRFVVSVDFKKPVTENLMVGPVQLRYSFHLPKDEIQATEFSSKGSMVGVVKNNDLYITGNDSRLSGNDIRITEDGGNGIVYGQSVHRNEFGISKGLFWSPADDKLAFFRMDERRVTDYPMFGIQPRPAKANSIKYPMAGDSSHTVTVGVYHIESKRLVYLNTQGTYDHYLTNITWTPDNKFIYVSWVNREQKKWNCANTMQFLVLW